MVLLLLMSPLLDYKTLQHGKAPLAEGEGTQRLNDIFFFNNGWKIRPLKKKHAFTLIEILMSILLLGIIAGSLMVTITNASSKERKNGLKNQFEDLFKRAYNLSNITDTSVQLLLRIGQDNVWEGKLIIVHKDAPPTVYFHQLPGLETLSLNNENVEAAEFLFCPLTGLSEYKLNGHRMPIEKEPLLVSYATSSHLSDSFTIPIKQYLPKQTQFSTFPDELYQKNT
jgi:prepilin-type N-terminal cleavage/methylation domain-containing protein